MKRMYLLLSMAMSVQISLAQWTLSLKDCIARGIENNLSLTHARIETDKGRNTLSQSRARLLPVLTGVFQFTDYLKQPVNVTTGTLLGSDFPDDPTWQTIRSTKYNATAGIQLTLPLYNQTVLAGINVARTVESLKQLSYDKAVEDLTLQISKVYYLAQTAQEQERLLDENIRRMDELCNITEALYTQGVVMEVDLTRVQISRQTLSAQKDQCHTLYEQHLNLLRFLLDMDPKTPFGVEALSQEVRTQTPSGVSLQVPEVRLAERQVELADRQIKATRAGYLPSLSLTGFVGGLGYQEKFHHFFHGKESSQNWFGNSFLTLTLRVPIFEADVRRLKVKELQFEKRQASLRKEQIEKQLGQTYANASLQLKHQLEMHRTQSDSYRQAKDVYQVTEEKYKEGVASMTELLQDEMRLQSAQASCVQAHCQCLMAQLELLKLSGSLHLLAESRENI